MLSTIAAFKFDRVVEMFVDVVPEILKKRNQEEKSEKEKRQERE
jgi:hypothetical protein